VNRRQIVILAFLAVVCIGLGFFYIFRSRSSLDESQPGNAQEITSAQVAQHTTPESCWIIFNTKVFNATPYLAQHPDSDIKSACGGQLQSTDKKLKDALNPFYIGLLVP